MKPVLTSSLLNVKVVALSGVELVSKGTCGAGRGLWWMEADRCRNG